MFFVRGFYLKIFLFRNVWKKEREAGEKRIKKRSRGILFFLSVFSG